MEASEPGQGPICRSCGAILREEVADLGLVPLSVDPVRLGTGGRPVACAPLRALVCEDCRLVQVAGTGVALRDAPRPAHGFAGLLAARLRLGPGTPVAAFDAAMLEPFRNRDIPARAVPTGALTALQLREALPPPVLLLAGAVLATAPDIQDALAGVRALLAPGGIAVFDLPDLLSWLRGNRFDLLSHALPGLPSVLVAEMLLGLHGLVPFEVEPLPGPGPWLRLLVGHAEDATKPAAASLLARRVEERAAELEGPDAYRRAAVAVAEARLAVLDLLVAARRDGRKVAGYGAGTAAATLAAACGIGPGLLGYTVHPDVGACGLELPGSQVPVLPVAALDQGAPDLLLVLDGTPPATVREVLARHGTWQGRLAVPLPGLHIV
ncbi:methyltransferase C-terminal domain-containing protein [Roseicella aerolata]|uniref:Methyltransferase C-terminal domain-containing protein n=1 Tax=Roseicella aerolata TaxID=2883479 RepID=A0A9X1IDL9_9PROT|nr:methyltransferase C-terminal domain-containing protein [Roseicella aerolata]MCB4822831.1 methyltransferase C-terminal domain-containing protein [Roseicella aerolata]